MKINTPALQNKTKRTVRVHSPLESQEALPLHLSHLDSPICVRQLLSVPYDTLQLDTAVLSYKLLITVIIS